jgi:hypothetical protein
MVGQAAVGQGLLVGGAFRADDVTHSRVGHWPSFFRCMSGSVQSSASALMLAPNTQ